MSAFNPISTTFHPPRNGDAHGAALLSALERNAGYRLSWDLGTTLVLGLLTAGLLPMVILLLRFRTFATSGKFHLEHVTEWMEKRGRATPQLLAATHRLAGGWPSAIWAGIAFAVAALLAAGAQVVWQDRSVLPLWSIYLVDSRWGIPAAYMLLVAGGFVPCSWVALKLFADRVQEYAHALDSASLPASRDIVVPAAPDWKWLACGVALLAAGCIWGPAMMLAAGAHRRYINQSTSALRADITARLRALMRQ
jgi:hypothetical protein